MKKMTYISAVTEALYEEMERDEKVFVIGEDVDIDGGVWNETAGLVERFGAKRVVGTPISEGAFTGLAAGAALTGLRPVVEFMYGDFIHVAMDQVANQIAKARLMFGGQATMPVVIRLCACGAGTREGAQHSQFLESWFAHLPGFTVVAPSTAADGKGLMKSAIRSDLPVIFVESRHVYYDIQDVPEGEHIVPIGKAAIRREGSQVTLASYGYAVEKALAAAEQLKDKVSVEVIDLRTLKPLDTETIFKSVEKTGRLIVAHDAPVGCSVGSEVVRRVVAERFDYLDAPPVAVGSKDVPIPFNDQLEDYTVLSVQDIVDEIMKISQGII